MTISERAHAQLVAAGYDRYIVSCIDCGDHWDGFLRPCVVPMLRADDRFESGGFWQFHTDVGTHLVDFRSYRGALGPGSLQLVISQDPIMVNGEPLLAYYADVDHFNPYQDAANATAHLFGEVLWPTVAGWFRRRHA